MCICTFAVGTCVPLLRRDFGISRSLASTQNFFYAAGVMLVAATMSRLLRKYQPLDVMRWGWILVLLGTTFFVLGRTLWITVEGSFLLGAGSGLFGNINMALIGRASHNVYKFVLIATGLGSIFGAFAGSYVGEMVRIGFGWRISIFIPILLITAYALWTVPKPEETLTQNQEKISEPISREMVYMVIFAFGCIFTEVAMGSWAIDLLTSRGAKVGTSLIYSSGLSYLIGVSRIIYCNFRQMNIRKLWFASTLLLLAGLLTLIFTHSAALTVLGLIIGGFGLGPLGGVAFAMCMKSDHGVHVGVASFSLGSGMSLSIAPFFMGFMSDRWGFKLAYSTIIVGVFVTLGMFLLLSRKKIESVLQ